MSGTEANNHLEIGEPGRGPGGERVYVNRRLYMQLLAFGSCRDSAPLVGALEDAGFPAVLYEDINDHQGVGLLTFAEDPSFFLGELRTLLNRDPFASLDPKGEYTMLGRTYTIGYEADPEDTLIGRPTRRVLDPELRWAVWYPLRRAGAFEQLAEEEQRAILAEHGSIGRSYGKAGLAYDIRLDCHGLNKEDNDFVIGVLGRELHPLSLVVQRMRKTRQTSQYLTTLGPFFTGRVVWQSPRNTHGGA